MNPELAFQITFFVLVFGLLLIRSLSAREVRRAGESNLPSRQAIQREGIGIFAGRVILFLFLVTLIVLYALNPPWLSIFHIPLPDWLRWLGAALGVVSLVLWGWTQYSLGKYWSTNLQLRQDHRLVTNGPYAQVRHPLYTAMMGYGTSMALVSAQWGFLLMALLMIVGVIFRAPKEEQMMIGQFGEEYRQYMQRTGRFLPKM